MGLSPFRSRFEIVSEVCTSDKVATKPALVVISSSKSWKKPMPEHPTDTIKCPASSASAEHTSSGRLLVLDGWRAISILLVLAAHMLPLGPRRLDLNSTAGLAGMSLFFTLSGFLITTNLLRHANVTAFVVRRLCRILPLAYTATVVMLMILGKDYRYYLAHFFFIENYAHPYVTSLTGHFWSLCVEVHFYAFVAMWMLLFGRPGLRSLPLLALMVTALRIVNGSTSNIKTHLRVDEILAGATLALIWADELRPIGRRLAIALRVVPIWIWLSLFAASCWPATKGWMYVRPYLGAAVIGHTLLTDRATWSWLRNRGMRYVAEISYALYVIHPASMAGWLGTGHGFARYLLKRPISFAITFGLAHLSTFHMERHFIALGKHWSRALEARGRRPRQQEAEVAIWRKCLPVKVLRPVARADEAGFTATIGTN